RVPAELPQPLPRDRVSGLLAPLAHDAVTLPAGRSLHSAGRQPPWTPDHLPQPDDHDGARRTVARRGLDVRPVGRIQRARPLRRARLARAGATAGMVALAGDLQPDRVRLDHLPLAEPDGLGPLPVTLRSPRARRALERAGACRDRARDRLAARAAGLARAPA